MFCSENSDNPSSLSGHPRCSKDLSQILPWLGVLQSCCSASHPGPSLPLERLSLFHLLALNWTHDAGREGHQGLSIRFQLVFEVSRSESLLCVRGRGSLFSQGMEIGTSRRARKSFCKRPLKMGVLRARCLSCQGHHCWTTQPKISFHTTECLTTTHWAEIQSLSCHGN